MGDLLNLTQSIATELMQSKNFIPYRQFCYNKSLNRDKVINSSTSFNNKVKYTSCKKSDV